MHHRFGSNHSKLCALIIAAWLIGLTVLTPGPLQVKGAPADLTDALLLYQADNLRFTDINFQQVAEYYGLRWAAIDLASTPLTDSLLRDEAGQYYPTVGIDAANLSYLNSSELAILETAVDQGGLNLLITRVRSGGGYSQLGELADGEVAGATDPADTSRDYVLSASYPDILRELSGLTITGSSDDQVDSALTLASGASHVNVLVRATDDYGQTYPVFIRFQNGAGSILVDGGVHGHNLRWSEFWKLYYASREGDHFVQANFMEVVPLMMFVRYTAGEQAWQNNHSYANLTIDDPALRQPYANPNYWDELLAHMQAHNYHTTIAFIPMNYATSQQSVVDLFLTHPDRYSLVLHGNNHDPCPEFTDDIPLDEQRADLEQAIQRMDAHQALTGIPYGRIMVFPCRVSGESTLPLLKELNFAATINSEIVPLGGIAASALDFDMYPAVMDYRNYALVLRSQLQDRAPIPLICSETSRFSFMDTRMILRPRQLWTVSWTVSIACRGR